MKTRISNQENLAYHAMRLLILIGHCGKPRSSKVKEPAIIGRTLLAKLDFFMRYPSYLQQASEILGHSVTLHDLGLAAEEEMSTVESRMVRYLYGPWDSIYYPTLAYMIGKGLILPPIASKVDVFRLSSKGKTVLKEMISDPNLEDLIARAKTIYKLFNRYNGNRLKTFIYINFPEVVDKRIGELI